jgi:superfamily II DNA helicase RecQ
MKCRTIPIRLEQPFAAVDEACASEFMQSVRVRKVTAAMCQSPEPGWSVLVFFDEVGEVVSRRPKSGSAPASAPTVGPAAEEAAEKPAYEQPVSEEPGALDEEGLDLLASLKTWRSTRAAGDSLPPYCVAQNRSLEEIARTRPSTEEELAAIKGFGPARIEKYAGDILSLVMSPNGHA